MKNVSVLIAEDDAELRKVLHAVLEGEGFEVMTAENGATALWIPRSIPAGCDLNRLNDAAGGWP